MKILLLHFAGPFGGSSRSLYEMLKNLMLESKKDLELYFVTPKGTSERYFRELGEVVAVKGLPQFDHGQYSYYRGVRWLVLLREVFYVPLLMVAAIKLRAKVGRVDVIHVNDFVGIFSGLFFQFIFGGRLVVHVRSLVNTNQMLLRTRVINWLLKEKSDKVICIDGNVRRTVSNAVDVEVIHNGLNLSVVQRESETMGETVGRLKVGYVGNLLAQKGIVDLVHAAKICKDMGVNVEFHIFGDVAKTFSRGVDGVLKRMGLRQDVKDEVLKFVAAHNLEDVVTFHGFIDDLSSAYSFIDVICFPSHLNAPGRPVIEAAYYGVPAIVAVESPTSDTLVDGVTGLAVEPKSPSALANVFEVLSRDREYLMSLSVGAKSLSDRYYNQSRNSARVLEIYRALVNDG